MKHILVLPAHVCSRSLSGANRVAEGDATAALHLRHIAVAAEKKKRQEDSGPSALSIMSILYYALYAHTCQYLALYGDAAWTLAAIPLYNVARLAGVTFRALLAHLAT